MRFIFFKNNETRYKFTILIKLIRLLLVADRIFANILSRVVDLQIGFKKLYIC